MNDAIQGSKADYSNPFAVVLAGGVGGARGARAVVSAFGERSVTVVGNVGDDDTMYGVPVSPDLDTIVYTLAGEEHEHLDDIKLIGGKRYFPSRRHHTLPMLVAELESHGFRHEYSATDGDLDGLRVIVRK